MGAEPSHEIIGYGHSREEAVRSLDACLQYTDNIQLKEDKDGYYYVNTNKGKWRKDVYSTKNNGVFRAYLKYNS